MNRKIGKWKILTAILLGIVLAMSIAIGAFLVQRNAHFQGYVGTHGNIALFADITCLIPYNGTDFGEFMEVNERHQVQFYMKNTGNVPCNVTYEFFNGAQWTLVPYSVAFEESGVWQTYIQGSIMECWYAKNVTGLPLDFYTITLMKGQVTDIYAILTNLQTAPATADFNYLFTAVDA